MGTGLLVLAAACQPEETTTVTKNTPLKAPLPWENVTASATAVLSYDSIGYKVFPDARAAPLNAQELGQVERLLAACINTDNQQRRRLSQSRFARESIDQGLLIDLRNYNRQLIPVLNKQGEKEVWVRCFCKVPPYWRTRFVIVMDGGNCYFSVKLNLTRNRWYELMINGEA
ncbi:hypothetical protein [Hymenobacter edaphi]|nr:hypothetical protein [Hymenobacter edaphi]